jgi:hypothetical protein
MMEHPLIGSLDELSVDDLMAKVAELNRKLSFAIQSGNAHLVNQIRLALTNYQSEYQNRIRKNLNTPYDDVIDIS